MIFVSFGHERDPYDLYLSKYLTFLWEFSASRLCYLLSNSYLFYLEGLELLQVLFSKVGNGYQS